MKIIRTNIGLDTDGQRLSDDILCDDAHEIIIEHESIRIILRTLPGNNFITMITPDDTVRRTYMEHFGVSRIMQWLPKNES